MCTWSEHAPPAPPPTHHRRQATDRNGTGWRTAGRGGAAGRASRGIGAGNEAPPPHSSPKGGRGRAVQEGIIHGGGGRSAGVWTPSPNRHPRVSRPPCTVGPFPHCHGPCGDQGNVISVTWGRGVHPFLGGGGGGASASALPVLWASHRLHPPAAVLMLVGARNAFKRQHQKFELWVKSSVTHTFTRQN